MCGYRLIHLPQRFSTIWTSRCSEAISLAMSVRQHGSGPLERSVNNSFRDDVEGYTGLPGENFIFLTTETAHTSCTDGW